MGTENGKGEQLTAKKVSRIYKGNEDTRVCGGGAGAMMGGGGDYSTGIARKRRGLPSKKQWKGPQGGSFAQPSPPQTPAFPQTPSHITSKSVWASEGKECGEHRQRSAGGGGLSGEEKVRKQCGPNERAPKNERDNEKW
eukprot:RCo048156